MNLDNQTLVLGKNMSLQFDMSEDNICGITTDFCYVSDDNELLLFNFMTKKIECTGIYMDYNICAVKISGNMLFLGTGNNNIYVYDLETKIKLKTLVRRHQYVMDAHLIGEIHIYNNFVIGNLYKNNYIWNLESGEEFMLPNTLQRRILYVYIDEQTNRLYMYSHHNIIIFDNELKTYSEIVKFDEPIFDQIMFRIGDHIIFGPYKINDNGTYTKYSNNIFYNITKVCVYDNYIFIGKPTRLDIYDKESQTMIQYIKINELSDTVNSENADDITIEKFVIYQGKIYCLLSNGSISIRAIHCTKKERTQIYKYIIHKTQVPTELFGTIMSYIGTNIYHDDIL